MLVKTGPLFWTLSGSESIPRSPQDLCLGLLSLPFYGNSRTIRVPLGRLQQQPHQIP